MGVLISYSCTLQGIIICYGDTTIPTPKSGGRDSPIPRIDAYAFKIPTQRLSQPNHSRRGQHLQMYGIQVKGFYRQSTPKRSYINVLFSDSLISQPR